MSKYIYTSFLHLLFLCKYILLYSISQVLCFPKPNVATVIPNHWTVMEYCLKTSKFYHLRIIFIDTNRHFTQIYNVLTDYRDLVLSMVQQLWIFLM